MRTEPFLLRRVLAGVVIGLALLLIAFYGWVRYRTAQYHREEGQMLARYQQAYTACVTEGGAPASCAIRAHGSCLADSFWLVPRPFSADLHAVQTEAASKCAKLG